MSASGLNAGELEMLIDGLTDDVSFEWALIHLGIRSDDRPAISPPTSHEVEAAFESFDRLVGAGLVGVGRLEYVDGGPAGRVAPVKHISEPLADVRARVESACREATHDSDWAYSCWVVNTAGGDAAARTGLATPRPG
jgi:hypothetical protein